MSTLNKEKVITILKQCFDPEIPIDLWNLGLIYDINIDEVNEEVKIVMSLTTPGCTMGQYMADDIKTKLESLPNINKADVKSLTVFLSGYFELLPMILRGSRGIAKSRKGRQKQSSQT